MRVRMVIPTLTVIIVAVWNSLSFKLYEIGMPTDIEFKLSSVFNFLIFLCNNKQKPDINKSVSES